MRGSKGPTKRYTTRRGPGSLKPTLLPLCNLEIQCIKTVSPTLPQISRVDRPLQPCGISHLQSWSHRLWLENPSSSVPGQRRAGGEHPLRMIKHTISTNCFQAGQQSSPPRSAPHSCCQEDKRSQDKSDFRLCWTRIYSTESSAYSPGC